MKITLVADQLGAALDFVANAAPKKSPVMIVENVKLVVADGKLTLCATDLDAELSADLAAPDSEPGSTTASCARLKKLVAELPAAAEVTLTADGERLRITCGRGRWSLPTLPAADFPVLLPPGEDAATFVIPKAEVQRLVQRTSFAISEEETRWHLGGIHLCAKEQQLIAAATDGHRLAEVVVAVAPPDVMPAVIVPSKAIDALAAFADDVTVRVSAERVEFSAGEHRCVSKLIDGTFPDYAHILPGESENRVSADTSALLAAVKRLNAVVESKALDRAVGLEWGDGEFKVCLAREDDAGSEDIAPIACLGCGRVAVQAHYLIEQLDALAGDTVLIDHAAPSHPIRITRPDEAATTTVLMPLSWNRPAAVMAEPARKRARRK